MSFAKHCFTEHEDERAERIATLEAQLAEKERVRLSLSQSRNALEDEAVMLRAQLAARDAVIAEYARHDSVCYETSRIHAPVCKCGLDEALARAREVKP